MTTLAEILDAWATGQKKQFIIIYGPHRSPPNTPQTVPATIYEKSWIQCQWCDRDIATVHEKTIEFYRYYSINLRPADPDFFDQFRKAVRKVHSCVADEYVS